MRLALTALAALLFLPQGSLGRGQDYGPDTCRTGFVWREAFSGDHVCVDPAVRAQAASDNQQAALRRQPGGGAYGPDTCRAGFVWREARKDDHVCVTPQTRAQTASDNLAAASRFVRSQNRAAALAPDGGQRAGIDPRRIARQPPIQVRNPLPATPPPRPASGAGSKRGFDANGDPYREDTLPDGSKRREQRNGITVIQPDGTSRFYPFSFTRANAQPPTAPQLPADPSKGLNWVNYHNNELLRLIELLVQNDASEMSLFHRKENQTAGSDPFKQIGYRMTVLEVLAQP